jgi:hypothetical protein
LHGERCHTRSDLVQGFQIAVGARKKTDRRLLNGNGSQTADLKKKIKKNKKKYLKVCLF